MKVLLILTLLESCILYLSGASFMEELSEEQLEHYEYFISHPLAINRGNARTLAASGLMSSYQAASLADYRSRCGDVVSIVELAAVDGFGEAYARALQPFISLATRRKLGEGVKDSLRLRGECRLQGRVRKEGSDGGMKLFAESRGGINGNAALALRGRNMSFCSALNLERVKLVVGDFNMRFAQGAELWSGMSLSGYPTLAAFMRKPVGITPSRSYTSYFRGFGGSFEFGKSAVSAALAFPGLAKRMRGVRSADIDCMPVVNYTFFGGNFQWGSTVRALFKPDGGILEGAAGVDGSFCLGKSDVFGEMVLGKDTGGAWRSKLIVGGMYNVAYGRRLGVVLRVLPKDCGAAFGLEWGAWGFVAYASYNPSRGTRAYKSQLCWESVPGRAWQLRARWQERLRPADRYPLRSDLRMDVSYSGAVLRATLRANAVHCRGFAWLSYLELGAVGTALSAYARGTVYNAGSREDRIYCYRRELPGGFSVPAYHGKGFELSMIASYKFSLPHYRRASFQLLANSRPECKAQIVVVF